MHVSSLRAIHKNEHQMVKPFESAALSAHACFSHGHFILNAGYSERFDNIFVWEEPYQTYLAWKAGYKLYAMNDLLMWHQWEKSGRPNFGKDAQTFSMKKQKKLAGKKTTTYSQNEERSIFDNDKQSN